GDVSSLQNLCEQFQIHPLVLEDILNVYHLPKCEEFDDYLFVTLKVIYIAKNKPRILQEQISIILHKRAVITVQEKRGDTLSSIKDRIRMGRGKIRSMKKDYLFYNI